MWNPLFYIFPRKNNTLNTKSMPFSLDYKPMVHVTSTNRASPARDGLADNKIFKLSMRDALNEKQIAEKHFYLIFSVAKNRFVTETKTLLLTQDTKQPEGRAVCRA